MITKLTLKNFRCFENFTLEGICPVTLLAGANNVGKSTILESIFLFYNRYSNDVFRKLNGFRGVYERAYSPDILWESLFYNKDISYPINIKTVTKCDSKEQNLSFEKDESISVSTESHDAEQLNLYPTESNYYPLKMTFSCSLSNDISWFYISNGKMILTHKEARKTDIANQIKNIRYIGNHTFVRLSELTELFGELELNRKTEKCVEILQMLEPRIKYLTTLTSKSITSLYADIGLPTLISFNVLGDGINKLLLIILEMLAHPGSILLIDEIENGFHYSFYGKLWEVIGRLARDTGCQIIATTHSYECIKEAAVLSSSQDADFFSFIRLDRKDDVIVPKSFDNDSFTYAISKNLEVR